MLKGKTEIILTDVKTGEVERHFEENMITGALNDIYKGNPYGLLSNMHYFQTSFLGTHDTSLLNTAGGVLCFPQAIEEDSNHFYEPLTNDPTAYASNDAYSGEDSKRGSVNEKESGFDGINSYKFVWDFPTSQGNGVISCIALTHFKGGRGYYNNYSNIMNYAQTATTNKSCYGELGNVESRPIARRIKTVLAYSNAGLVVIDWNNKIGTIRVKSNRLNYDSFFTSANVEEKLTAPACNYICDGSEFYTITASGSTITWQRYNINCEQIGTGSWTFSGASFYSNNNRYLFAKKGSYIYIPNPGLNKVYKCNISNAADVSEIGAVITTTTYGDLMRVIGDEIFTANGILGADDVFRVSPTKLAILPFKRQGVWLMGYSEVNFSSNLDNQYNSLGRALQTNYLATINNLSSPVTKDSSKTMKIIYTLSEVNS